MERMAHRPIQIWPENHRNRSFPTHDEYIGKYGHATFPKFPDRTQVMHGCVFVCEREWAKERGGGAGETGRDRKRQVQLR